MRAEAIAEVDAEGLVYVDHHNRFCTRAEDFYKKALCAAHVVGIADPYRKRLESVQAIHRKLEDWNVRPHSDEPGYPVMYGKDSHNNEKERREKLKDEIRSYQEDRRNAQDMLAQDMMAYERAKFQVDCAARNIRTTEDDKRALTRFAVARADVASQDILDLHVTLSNVVWAGGTGRARQQPATYGI